MLLGLLDLLGGAVAALLQFPCLLLKRSHLPNDRGPAFFEDRHARLNLAQFAPFVSISPTSDSLRTGPERDFLKNSFSGCGDPRKLGFRLLYSAVEFQAFLGKARDLRPRNLDALLSMRKIAGQCAHTMVGRENGLFDLLDLGDEPSPQPFRLLQQTFETQRVGFACCHLTNRAVHLAVEVHGFRASAKVAPALRVRPN